MPEATSSGVTLVAPQAPSHVYLRQIVVPKADGSCEVEIRWDQNVSSGTYEIKGYYIDWILNNNSSSYSSSDMKHTWFSYTPSGLGGYSYTFSISDATRGQYLHLGLRAGYKNGSNQWAYTSQTMANLSRISPTPSLSITNITDVQDLTRTLTTSVGLGFTWRENEPGFNNNEPVGEPYIQAKCFKKNLNVSDGLQEITLYAGDLYFAKKENGGDLSDLIINSIGLYIFNGYEKFFYLIDFTDQASPYKGTNNWGSWNLKGDPVINFYNYGQNANKTIQNSGDKFYINRTLYVNIPKNDGALNTQENINYLSTEQYMGGQGYKSWTNFSSTYDETESEYPYGSQMKVYISVPFKTGAFSDGSNTTRYKTVIKTVYFLNKPKFSLSFSNAAFKPYLLESRDLSTIIDLTGVALEDSTLNSIAGQLQCTLDENTITTDKALTLSASGAYTTNLSFADLLEKDENDATKTVEINRTDVVNAKIKLYFADSFGNQLVSEESSLSVDFSKHESPNAVSVDVSITDSAENTYTYMQEGLSLNLNYEITGCPGTYTVDVLKNNSVFGIQQRVRFTGAVYAEFDENSGAWAWVCPANSGSIPLGQISVISDNDTRQWSIEVYSSDMRDKTQSNSYTIGVIKHIAPTIIINSITANNSNELVVNYTIGDSFNNGAGMRTRVDRLKWGTNGSQQIYSFTSSSSSENPSSSFNNTVTLSSSGQWDTRYFQIEIETTTSQGVMGSTPLSKTIISPQILVYNVVPTISYRKNQIGINTSSPDSSSVLDIHPTSNNTLVILNNSDSSSKIIISLNNMTIDID